MDQSGSRGYIIENNHDNPIAELISSHDVKIKPDLNKVCMGYGFSLAKINGVADLKNISLLSLF